MSTAKLPPLPPWSEKLTRWLDDGLTIPGTRIRFGLDAIIGALLPGAGDALTAVGSTSLLLLALRRGVPTVVLLRMLFNIALDATLGAIPVVGDIFDVAFKSNRRNLELIERCSTEGQPARPVDYLVVGLACGLLVLSVLAPFVLWALLLGSLGGK